MAVQDDDKFIVNRGGTDYKVSASDLDDKLQDNDQVLINRGGTDYKVSGADLRQYLGIVKPPPWEGHDGGVFHLLGDLNNINIFADVPIYEFGNGEHIITTGIDCNMLFTHSPGEWWFGPLTDTSRVTRMNSMFSDCSNFNSDISNWDTSKVEKMSHMFYNCRSFNQDLSQWCVDLTRQHGSFDEGCDAWTLPKPVWGTCPRGENKP